MLDAVARPTLVFSAATSLSADIGARETDTIVAVTDAEPFPSAPPYIVKIGTEYMRVTAGAGTLNWKVSRGVNNSSPTQHFRGDGVVLATPNPFASWHEGTDGDYHTMFIELWAYLADVLTFYQERIANEALITTAVQRDSLVRLAELIDYHPNPGSGASALVALMLAKGAEITVPADFRVGSRAQPGKPAAVFETESAITANADQNTIALSATAQADQFMPRATPTRSVVLQGMNNRLAVGDYLLVVENEAATTGEKTHLYQITGVSLDKASNTTTIIWQEPAGTQYDQTSKEVTLYALRVKAGPFGNNAPAWNSLPATLNVDGPFKDKNWDASTISSPPGTPNPWYYLPTPGDPAGTVFLDGIYDAAQGTPEAPGWAVLLTDSEIHQIVHVIDNRPAGKAAYALSSRATRLTFREPLQALTFPLRNTVILTGRERLTLQNNLPRPDPLTGSTLKLAGLYPQLQKGQTVILQGKLWDSATNAPTQISNAESRILDGPPVLDANNSITTVTLNKPLDKQYVLASAVLMANVVEVTHGETVKDEVFGSGDGSPFQTYRLKQKPLTYLPSTDPEGVAAVQSTLLVTVNGVQWSERPTLLESAADAQEFTTTLDDAGQTAVVFGDGLSGAIPPSGRDNIHARYRKGLGSAGNVPAGAIQQLIDSLPGLQRVTNPQPSSGGADPESLEQIRVNAPSSLRTFDRAVSAEDYAALALSYPGIAKAAARWVLRDAITLQAVPQPYIQVTVATANRVPLSAQPGVPGKLRNFLDKRRDPNVPLRIIDFTPVYIDVAVTVDIDDRFPQQATLTRVQAALNPGLNPDGSTGYFAFERLGFGQTIHLSAVYAAIQALPGIRDARITTLRRMDLDATDPSIVRDDIFIRPTEIAVIQNDPGDASKGTLTVTRGRGGFVDT
jgi:predicted phage baseplate assembly protein